MKNPVSKPRDRSADQCNATSGRSSFTSSDLATMERQLLISGSIELTSRISSTEPALNMLPAGMPVFVPSLPKRPVLQNLETLTMLKQYGFEPVPHVAARRLTGSKELRQFLDIAVRQAGVRKVLLIGGDVDTSEGPFESAEDVLKSRILEDVGIAGVGVAAYPEPHPRIDPASLDRSLASKMELLERAGLAPFIVTQFSLDPNMPVELCARLDRELPGVPVYIGIPGPTSVAKLVKYAKFCGVGASLRALRNMGFRVAGLGNRAASDAQMKSLASYCLEHDASTVRGVHVFSFGGFRESAEWITGRTGASKKVTDQERVTGGGNAGQ